MQLGTFGLGRMGRNMAQRLLDAGHEVAAYDLDAAQLKATAASGVAPAASLEDLVRQLRSWLIDLLARAFDQEGPGLERIAGYIDDSGTGRWTIEYAVQKALPLPAITDAVFARFASRTDDPFGARVIAALRQQFGGHAVRSEGGA